MTSAPIGSHYEVEDLEYQMVGEGRVRIWIGLAVFSFALLLIVLRLAEVALLTQPPSRFVGSEADFVERTDIEDRNGALLATTIDNYALYVRPRKILDKEAAVTGILSIMPSLDARDLRRRVNLPRDEVRIARGLVPAQRRALVESGLPGLFTRAEPMRTYPNGSVASHVLGLVNIDLEPMSGVEYSFNDDITAAGAPPKALSIDLRVQMALEDEIAKSVDRFEAQTGAGVVLDINTGEVLGLASLPEFDPNNRGTISPHQEKNTATNAIYDLGSVFKPLTVAMALDRGVITPDEEFPVQKPFTIQKKLIRDDHPSKTPLDVAHVLSESSNRGTALMALRAGGDMQQDFFKDVGLFDKSQIELRGLAQPQYHREWQISKDTSEKMAELMRFVVTDGTGRNADVPGLGVMGKTGTADKPAIGGYDTQRLVTSFIAAFPVWDPKYVVMITLDEPKAVEGTHGFATAGWNAAPTAGRVMSRIAPMLTIPPKPVKTAEVFNIGEAGQ